MSTFNSSGFFPGGDSFLRATNADFHNRQNIADQAQTDETKYRVVEASGVVHRYLSKDEMDRLCLSSPGCRVTKEH